MNFDPGCTGKTQYATKADATRVLVHRKREKRVGRKNGRQDLKPYHCHFCRQWHLGSHRDIL